MVASNTNPFPDVGSFTALLAILFFFKAICCISQKAQRQSITAAANFENLLIEFLKVIRTGGENSANNIYLWLFASHLFALTGKHEES